MTRKEKRTRKHNKPRVVIETTTSRFLFLKEYPETKRSRAIRNHSERHKSHNQKDLVGCVYKASALPLSYRGIYLIIYVLPILI